MSDQLDIASLRGQFRDGYTGHDTLLTLPVLGQILGARFVTLWADYNREYGFGGDSDLAIVEDDGSLTDLSYDLWEYLNFDARYDEAPTTPTPDAIRGSATGIRLTDYPIAWDGVNFAAAKTHD
jgi:hypothetical protein